MGHFLPDFRISKSEMTHCRATIAATTLSLMTALMSSLRATHCVRLTDVRMPEFAIDGQALRMRCHYDLDDERLYSVKWYRNGREFYRYIPQDRPPTRVFNSLAVRVNQSLSTATDVILDPVNIETSGKFKCEVSGEAPQFPTAFHEAQVTVIHLPSAGPVITGARPSYTVGDRLNVNCTSAGSRPPTSLRWYVNGELIKSDNHDRQSATTEHKSRLHKQARFGRTGSLTASSSSRIGNQKMIYTTRHYAVTEDPRTGLATSTLGLSFVARRAHFHGDSTQATSGELKLKCTATIASVYWKSNEESVQGYIFKGDGRSAVKVRYPPPFDGRQTGRRRDGRHSGGIVDRIGDELSFRFSSAESLTYSWSLCIAIAIGSSVVTFLT